MTADEIRATYVAVVGEDAVDLLAAAGLLPTVEAVQWRVDQTNRVTTGTRDTIPYIKQHQLSTAWADLPPDGA